MVLQVVVMQMVHSGARALCLKVLLQHEVGGCGHSAGGVTVHGHRTHTSAGGGLLSGQLAFVV